MLTVIRHSGFARLFLLVLAVTSCLCAQESSQVSAGQNTAPATAATTDNSAVTKSVAVQHGTHLRSVPKNILLDQEAFWTSPARMRVHDLNWIVPLSFATALSVGADTAIEPHLPSSTSTISRSKNLSNAGVAALVGTAGGMFLWGHATGNDHLRETGLLSGEAFVDAFAINTAFKTAFGRERPVEGDSRGRFWEGGQSFPSDHAAVSWAVASVIAHEYPGWMTKLLAYGTAATVSATRVTGRQHFTSDVLVGSALGWYLGRQVFRAHSSDPEINAANWGTFEKAERETERDPDQMGSTYVPLDSWVYPAMDRLAALGYTQTAFAGLRPWTRLECARLTLEAADAASASESESAERMIVALKNEFAPEIRNLHGDRNVGAEVESIYTRITGISGTPLRDGYHFAQTIVNDYGRPYAEGFNAVTGTSIRAQAGPFAFYVRGEYQHAPEAPTISAEVKNAIATVDQVSQAQMPAQTSYSRLRLLDAYVGLKISRYQLSFGKQSLWWGPTASGSLLFSDNAEPITMLRLDQATPIKLPSVLGLLGPMRTQFFVGQLSGQEFVSGPSGVIGQAGVALNPQPYIHGEKVSFRPTPNLEFSFSRTVMFGGPGFPVTLRTFWNSFSSASTSNASSVSSAQDPGDRRSAFDFSYRVPGLRNWLVIYTDSFVDDEVSPVAYPSHAAWHPGFYLPQIPHLRRLDFRAEGAFTPPRSWFPGFYYYNIRYRSGYTNNGMLMGNWVGREGKGVQLSSTYWMSAESKLQASYRDMQVDREFLEGGRVKDVKFGGEILIHPDLSLASSLQYERWNFPLLSPGTQTNVAVSVQLTYWPHWRMK